MKKWCGIILLILILCSCESTPPPVGTIVINSDLPQSATGKLRIGLTLNPTSRGRDVLTTNLIVNGSFDLAPALTNCTYDYSNQTITTPNGYTTFYPLPQYAYCWHLDGGKGEIKQHLLSETNHSHYYSVMLNSKDSITYATLQNNTPISIKKDQEFTFTASLRAPNSTIRAFLVSSDPMRVVSDLITIRPHADWDQFSATLTALDNLDSAYLRVQILPLQSLLTTDTLELPQTSSTVADLDNVNLTTTDRYSLARLLEPLQPYYLRFPDGRTANGFYLGTYPVHFQEPLLDSAPIWTIHGAEYTGSFSVRDFLSLAREIDSQPILVENVGITDVSAAQRIEDIALIEKRSEYLKHVFRSAQYDSLLIQLGYRMPTDEYQRRFSAIESSFIADTLSTNFISATWLTNSEQPYSDYICDFALPSLRNPNFSEYLPEEALRFFSQPQPFMLGEVHFASSDELDHYIPPFTLRAAFLIEAEKHAHLIRGLSLYPLISQDIGDMPILLMKGGTYHPTPLYEYLLHFSEYSGTQIRTVQKESHGDDGLYASLSSTKDNTVFFLKLANTTRHMLPYTIQMEGKGFKAAEYSALRFRPISTTTVGDPHLLNDFTVVEEKRQVSKKQFTIAVQPFEAILLEIK